MFAESYKKSFEEWWFYHYMKNLWGYTQDQMKEFTDYKPGPPFVEGAKTRAFSSAPYPAENDATNYGDPGDEDDNSGGA